MTLTPFSVMHFDLELYKVPDQNRAENLLKLWRAPFGMPFEGLYIPIADAVSPLLSFLFAFSAFAAIFAAPSGSAARRLVIGAFLFLVLITILHVAAFQYINPRMRAPYEPVRVLLAGMGAMWLAEMATRLYRRLRGHAAKAEMA
jgi:hypothetical protein